MAKPRAAKPEAAALPEIAPEDAIEFLTAEDVNPALERIYSEMGVDDDGRKATVYVYKLNDENATEPRIWQGPPDDYDLPTLVKKFGSGNYRVKIYVQHETGRMVVKANQVLPFLLEPAEDARIKAQRENTPPPQPTATQAATPAINPVELATVIAQAVKAALPPPAPQVNMLETMQHMAGIFKMMQPPAPVQQPAPQLDAMAMFKMGAELAKGATGEPPDAITKLIETFGPALVQATQRQQLPETPQAAPAPALAAPQSAIPENAGDDVNIANTIALKTGVAFLLKQAVAQRSPQLYADVVADQLPQSAIDELLAMDGPQCVEYLAQFNPQVRNFAPWFSSLRDEIAALFAEDETPEVPAPAADNVVKLDTPQ